jgi:RNA polymerase sigma factor (sigma-70 family)
MASAPDPSRGEVPEEWIQEHDCTAEAERVARLAADEELAKRVQAEGFDGKTWYFLSVALVAYGTQVIRAWVRTGQIFSHCREKGFKVRNPPPDGICSLDVVELADETVAYGITRFKTEVLAMGVWDPKRGASLKTFFVGMCLKQFPTTYTDWGRRDARETRERQAQTEIFRSTTDPRVGWRSEAMAESLEELLEDVVPDRLTREILRLRSENYSQAEIAELLGVTEGSIESRLHRLRKGLRGQPRRTGESA